jgi:Alanine-zipper, major outer membrane lipoprotein
VNEMRLGSISAGLASLMLVTVIGAGCHKEDTASVSRAEAAATRAEDAARRAEAAASRVEAAAQRAEAAADKAERMFSKHLHK